MKIDGTTRSTRAHARGEAIQSQRKGSRGEPGQNLKIRQGMMLTRCQTADLKALMQTYQIWAHRMFPKGDFMGTMTRVENNLRTRRMEVRLFRVSRRLR